MCAPLSSDALHPPTRGDRYATRGKRTGNCCCSGSRCTANARFTVFSRGTRTRHATAPAAPINGALAAAAAAVRLIDTRACVCTVVRLWRTVEEIMRRKRRREKRVKRRRKTFEFFILFLFWTSVPFSIIFRLLYYSYI